MTDTHDASECVAFVNSPTDLQLAKNKFPDAAAIRVPLYAGEKLLALAADSKIPLWIDSGADGFHHILTGVESFAIYRHRHDQYAAKLADYGIRRSRQELKPGEGKPVAPQIVDWMEYFENRTNARKLGEQQTLKVKSKPDIRKIVAELLDPCIPFAPAFLSVPQLPVVLMGDRNRINKELASATRDWRKANLAQARLIIPVVFSQRQQTSEKKRWGPKIEQVKRCIEAAGAESVWVVDSTLNDHTGVATNDRRFEELIRVHEACRAVLDPTALRIAGPYWALNLLLWSRQLAIPAISMGTGFQYGIPGRRVGQGRVRVPLGPLKRRALAEGTGLKKWLEEAVSKLDTGDDGRKRLSALLSKWDSYSTREKARQLTVDFYRHWFEGLSKLHPSARSIALYQMFSQAYVVGRQLELLPEDKPNTRDPAALAKQLMMHCLS